MHKLKKYLNIYSLFFLIAIIFGSLFALFTPYLWGVDETTQFARVYQISEGHLTSEYFGDQQKSFGHEGYGGYIPTSLLNLIKLTDNNLASPGFIGHEQPIGWVTNAQAYNKMGSEKFSKKHSVYTFTNTSSYSPAAYAPSLVGLEFSKFLNFNMGLSIITSRLFDLIFYCTCTLIGLWVLSFTRAKWLLFAVALIPQSLYQASIVSADAVVNALALLYSALLVKTVIFRRELTRSQSLLLFVCLIVMPITKPTYIFLDALALSIPSAHIFDFKFKNVFKFGSLVLGLGLFAWWTKLTAGVAKTIGLMAPVPWSIHWSHQQIVFLMERPFSFILIIIRTLTIQDNDMFHQLIGSFGFNAVQIPAIATVATIVSLSVAFIIIDKSPSISEKKLWYFIIILGTSIVSIFATLYITFTEPKYPVVNGVQGRYFLPFVFIVLILLATSKYLRPVITKSQYKFAPLIISGLIIFSLVVSFSKFFYITWG